MVSGEPTVSGELRLGGRTGAFRGSVAHAHLSSSPGLLTKSPTTG
jgi:hypothetical protein